MRILVVSNYKIGSETGTAVVTEKMCLALSKKHEVVYMCLGNKFVRQKISKNLTYLKIPSVDIKNINLPFVTPVIYSKIVEFITDFSPDIVHSQNAFFICDIAQRWSFENKIPFVTTFHHVPTQAFEHLLPKLSSNFLGQVVQDIYVQVGLKFFLSRTNCVIALNETIKKSVKSVDKKIRVEIINNGLNLEKFLKIKINKPSSELIRFLFLGSYVERKNQEYLIKIFQHLPMKYQLFCFGDKKTGKDYYNKISSLVKENRIKNVFLNDFIKTESDVVKEYAKSDFFITTSLKEAQSLAIIQSFASGKPVIGLENDTLSELVTNLNGLVVGKNKNPEKFANELIKFVNENKYISKAKQARKDSSRFNINVTVEEMESVYKKLVSSSK